MLSIDWQAPGAYSDIKAIPARGFAWEYLRRDENYHADYLAISRMEAPDDGIVAGFSRRWGLRFPQRSRTPIRPA